MSEEYEPLPSWHQNSAKEVFQELESEKDEQSTEEKKNLLRRFIDWLKCLPAEVKSKVLGLTIDIDGKVTLEDILSVRKAFGWFSNAGATEAIKFPTKLCPTNLCPGDHIAVKTKRSRIWWNHMIVTDVYPDGSGFDVICPCMPQNTLSCSSPQDVKLESDLFSVKDIKHYFTMGHRQCEMQIWEFPMTWNSVRKVVRFNHNDNKKFSPEQIVERAREQVRSDVTWNLYNDSSEQLVAKIIDDDIDQNQKMARQKGIAVVGEASFSGSFSIVKITFKVLLKVVKYIIKMLIRETTEEAITKTAFILKGLGFFLGPIMDAIACGLAIVMKIQRYRKGKIEKHELSKFVTKKIAELVINLAFSVLCFLIPPSFLIIVVISIIAFLVSKAVGFVVGCIHDYFVK